MSHIKLILKEDVDNLGHAGEVVSVKPGFARNFLVPQGKAIPATADRVRELEHHQRVVAERVAREMKSLQAVRAQLEAVVIEVRAQAGEEGKLFGSVTSMQIAELLGEKGYEIDRRKVVLPEPIKEIGEHKVAIRLRSDIEAAITVVVSAAE